MKHDKPIDTGGSFTSSVMFLMVAWFLGWMVEKLLGAIFAPFRPTDRDALEAKVRDAGARKVQAREARLGAWDRDPSDPMHQFQARFLTDPKAWKGDKDNDAYLNWYKAWKDGKVVDTNLRWAPPVLDDGGNVNGNFAGYLSVQVDLHCKGPAWRRFLFLRNIDRFYPEFQPSLAGLAEDVAAYTSEAKATAMSAELDRTLEATGLPEEAVEYLRKVPAKKLREAIEKIRAAIEFGCEPEVACTLHEQGIALSDEAKAITEKILYELKLPSDTVGRYARKELSAEDVAWLGEQMLDTLNIHGSDCWDQAHGEPEGVCLYDALYERYLKQVLSRKRVRKVDKLCTQKARSGKIS